MFRILILEDLPSDFSLVEREIGKTVVGCLVKWADNEADFKLALDEFRPDLILSDFSIPGFDWYSAFRQAREKLSGIPFIIVTGSTNPKIIAGCLEAGVNGCISKSEIKKLGPMIRDLLNRAG